MDGPRSLVIAIHSRFACHCGSHAPVGATPKRLRVFKGRDRWTLADRARTGNQHNYASYESL